MQPTPPPVEDMSTGSNDLGIGLKIVSFCFPIVGIILWAIKKQKEPVAAKQACTFAIAGIILGVIINIIYYVFIGMSN
jgi:hypothetical protein